ncbi:hypothetical protein [Streptomyces sp. Tue6028]|uniref:hypothetical protein n=1 Tax=Streptomyces sp. Tue6028 TaxID=2036037 RepID=UPI003EC04FCF
MIKPRLVRLSGSGADLDEGVVERDLERAGCGAEGADAPTRHVVVVHTGGSADLSWTADGRPRRERFHRGQALVNRAGWASRPRWEQDAELMVVALEPAWLEKLATESALPGPLELAPRYHLTRSWACWSSAWSPSTKARSPPIRCTPSRCCRRSRPT